MKGFKILIATVVLSAFTLTSCSDDDNNVQVPTSIVGKWNYSKTVTQTNVGEMVGQAIVVDYTGDEIGCDRDFIEFKADMTVNRSVFFKNAQGNCDKNGNDGIYTKSGNIATISLPEDAEFSGTFKITKLTSNNMWLERTTTIGSSTLIVTQELTKGN